MWVLLKIGAIASDRIHLYTLTHASPGTWAAIAGSAIAIPVWLFFFTERTVRTPAFTYADTLLRSRDTLS